MFVFWRLFYALIDSHWLVSLLRTVIAAADTVKPGAALTVLETRVGESWPRNVPGWVNIHISRLLWRLRRTPASPLDRAPARIAATRLRIGCLAPFSGALGFPPWLFAAFPTTADLFVYDVEYRGRLAPALAEFAAAYRPFAVESAHDTRATARTIAEAINSDTLDLLLVVRGKRDAYDVLDLVRTPCVGYICTASDVLHHPNVDFNLYCQPEADFFPVGTALFNGFTRSPVPNLVAYPASLCFDPRNLDLTAPAPRWRERQPLIVFHGSLYKLESEPFLDCLFGLMREVDDTQFAFMGKDARGARARIEAKARKAGLDRRVHYEGTFSAMRDASGQIHDPGWDRLLDLLTQARLVPDPWPVGGASARFEAYVLGAPTVHMGLRTDRASWGRRQLTICEVPNLLVPDATSYSVSGYRRIAASCLTDETFADRVTDTQRACALRACDRGRYWQHILDTFERWRGSPGLRQTA